MKTLSFMTYASLFSLLLFLFSCADDDTPSTEPMKEQLQALTGTYMDLEPYAYGEAFGQRIFTFEDGTWTLRFTLGLDPQLTQPVFEFRTYGTYQVLDPSAAVEGAYEALFLEEKKFLTLKTDNEQLVAAFGLAGCGLEAEVEKDISVEGCALWPPVADCNEDHDLLSLDEQGLLYFGVRPADNNMCTADRRPTALTPGVSKI